MEAFKTEDSVTELFSELHKCFLPAFYTLVCSENRQDQDVVDTVRNSWCEVLSIEYPGINCAHFFPYNIQIFQLSRIAKCINSESNSSRVNSRWEILCFYIDSGLVLFNISINCNKQQPDQLNTVACLFHIVFIGYQQWDLSHCISDVILCRSVCDWWEWIPIFLSFVEPKRERLQDFLTAMLDASADALRPTGSRQAGELRQYREMGDQLAVDYSVALSHVVAELQSGHCFEWFHHKKHIYLYRLWLEKFSFSSRALFCVNIES